jgi:hypothetical protein
LNVGSQEPSEESMDRLGPKRLGVVYGRRSMEQVCSLNNIIGGRVWSIGEVAQIMFEFGEGFIIDFDGWTMQFDRTSIVDRVLNLLFFINSNVICDA